MLASTPSDYSALLPFSQGGASSVATRRELWRHDRCTSDCQRPTMALSWVLAIALACLSIGGLGLTRPVHRPFQLLSMTPAPVGEEKFDLAMVEMSAPTAEDSSETPVEEIALDMVLPQPETLPELVPETQEDLPEVAEVLTADDLFTVPAAPPVEDMLKPETPRRPAPTPAPPARPRTTPTTASRSPATGSTTTGTATGGTGGTGTSARGSSKGYFPAPPYPAAARSRGIQGTVYLSITFGANGRVTAASVSRSSGYSDLDRVAGDWVRRNWRAPAGQIGTFRQPVQFRLR
jgi:protein TonB